jgi:hypothetical protein
VAIHIAARIIIRRAVLVEIIHPVIRMLTAQNILIRRAVLVAIHIVVIAASHPPPPPPPPPPHDQNSIITK